MTGQLAQTCIEIGPFSLAYTSQKAAEFTLISIILHVERFIPKLDSLAHRKTVRVSPWPSNRPRWVRNKLWATFLSHRKVTRVNTSLKKVMTVSLEVFSMVFPSNSPCKLLRIVIIIQLESEAFSWVTLNGIARPCNVLHFLFSPNVITERILL